jgi:hypothetical protein
MLCRCKPEFGYSDIGFHCINIRAPKFDSIPTVLNAEIWAFVCLASISETMATLSVYVHCLLYLETKRGTCRLSVITDCHRDCFIPCNKIRLWMDADFHIVLLYLLNESAGNAIHKAQYSVIIMWLWNMDHKEEHKRLISAGICFMRLATGYTL